MKIIGWLSVVLAIVMLMASLVPGAMSMLAFYSSLFILAISITTIKSTGVFYFNIIAVMTFLGMVFFNDYLRLFGAFSSATLAETLGLYSLFLVIGTVGAIYTKKSY